MFPLLTNKQTLPCDLMMEKEKILDIFPVFELDDNPPESLWENGFNTVIDSEFTRQAEEFLANCRHLKKRKSILFHMTAPLLPIAS